MVHGELKTYVQSAICSNPSVVQAFSAANYKHMALIQGFVAKRLELQKNLIEGRSPSLKVSTNFQILLTGFGLSNGGDVNIAIERGSADQ